MGLSWLSSFFYILFVFALEKVLSRVPQMLLEVSEHSITVNAIHVIFELKAQPMILRHSPQPMFLLSSENEEAFGGDSMKQNRGRGRTSAKRKR